MTNLTYSRHAETRMSQRGIGRSIVDLILVNGTKIGRNQIVLKEKTATMMIHHLKKELKEHKDLYTIQILNQKIAQVERATNKVIVVIDGHLVTVYHLTRAHRMTRQNNRKRM